MPDFLHPGDEIDKHRHHLPHWQQDEAVIFITWRLADALPTVLLHRFQHERKIWLELNPEPWSESTRHEYHQRFSWRLEELLDSGHGSCVLRDPAAAKLVADALQHFDGQRYRLEAFVVMPNHVHVLMSPAPGHLLAGIVHSWKRHSARQVNIYLRRTGPLWQEDYWDRLIRSADHLRRAQRYVRENPARLREGEYVLWERG